MKKMNYKIVLLIVVITILLLISIIEFFPLCFFACPTIPAPSCVFNSTLFSCRSYTLLHNGVLVLNLMQTTNGPINVTAAGCNTNQTAVYNLQPQSGLSLIPIGANFTVAARCYSNLVPFSGQAGGYFSGYFFLNYTDRTTGIRHVVNVQLNNLKLS